MSEREKIKDELIEVYRALNIAYKNYTDEVETKLERAEGVLKEYVEWDKASEGEKLTKELWEEQRKRASNMELVLKVNRGMHESI